MINVEMLNMLHNESRNLLVQAFEKNHNAKVDSAALFSEFVDGLSSAPADETDRQRRSSCQSTGPQG